ncbi:MAG: hypothetical protein JWL90_1984 [Chthoniobacteraceae bacterium]|nr:hypothetical protein [Chthoniobacteraceae bacterium]
MSTKAEQAQDAFKQINLRILAPPMYWNNWSYPAEKEITKSKILELFESIISQVNHGITEAKIDSKLTLVEVGELAANL